MPVIVSEDGVQVEAWIPYEDFPQPHQGAAQVPANVRPQFERTESGRFWYIYDSQGRIQDLVKGGGLNFFGRFLQTPHSGVVRTK